MFLSTLRHGLALQEAAYLIPEKQSNTIAIFSKPNNFEY
jgi:hypothetical protein